jgi:muconolactone delta-isomerase
MSKTNRASKFQESMGSMGAKIESKARELGYVAHVSSHWMSYGEVSIHCRDEKTNAERVQQAKSAFPHFRWKEIEKIPTGGHTIRGWVVA